MPPEHEYSLPESLPILPLQEGVAFPYSIIPLTVTDPAQIELVDRAVVGNKIIGLVASRGADTPANDPDDLYGVGTAAGIVKLYRFPGEVVRLSLKGLARFAIRSFSQKSPFLVADVEQLHTEWPQKPEEVEAWRKNIEMQLKQIVELSPGVPEEVQLMGLLKDPERLGFIAAAGIEANTQDKQAVLEENGILPRLRLLSQIMSREIKILKLRNKIQGQVRSEIEKDQKEYWLKEQMKAIQKELGSGEGENPEAAELREKLAARQLPQEVRKAAEEEIDRLARMPSGMPEVAVSRNYVDLILQLPWTESTEDQIEIDKARTILDQDHYDLKDVKERILEFLAVRKLNRSAAGPILCFVGPPGVGKTSMGRSIARATGRKFVRISLGGVHDEAEIRGHRRTYVGAMPGRIIQGLREAGSNNPVFMLDEVDKIGRDFRGDPTSALLEVLDQEQNFSFRDNYLNVPFDLSSVEFITTANLLDTIPPALLDRMEVIRLSGYTVRDKREIARRYLIPKQLKSCGLTGRSVRFSKNGLTGVIEGYTREAGVRELERQIGKIARRVAVEVASGRDPRVLVTKGNLGKLLGPVRYLSETAGRSSRVGVATGLAWTPSGGEILFVETTTMPGSGQLVLTGQLGDVMKESARAALSWVRSHAESYGIESDFQKLDLHVHVPAGATPKDGPSAGVAIALSILSAVSGTPVRHDVAVTGEMTLHGRVMAVGGIREKVIGAAAAGIQSVLIPRENVRDLEEVDADLRREMRFLPVDTVEDAVSLMLLRGGS
ncbi:endopeptidase La [Candidatus Fermentibacteria bacterium]|nr:endopeptidase La [Candidatus Fermentibacteria bacterium]